MGLVVRVSAGQPESSQDRPLDAVPHAALRLDGKAPR